MVTWSQTFCSCATKRSVYCHSLMSPDSPWIWRCRHAPTWNVKYLGLMIQKHNILLLRHERAVALYSRPLLQGLGITVQKAETLNLNIFLLLLCRKVTREMIISEIRRHKSEVYVCSLDVWRKQREKLTWHVGRIRRITIGNSDRSSNVQNNSSPISIR